MTIVKKVDRIQSLSEALKFQKLGADILTVDIKENALFPDERFINVQQAKNIKSALNFSSLGINYSSGDSLEKIWEIMPDFIQIFFPANLSDQEIDRMKRMQEKSPIKVILSGLEISYDDEISWIESDFQENMERVPGVVHFLGVNLLPDLNNAWLNLQQKSPLYPEEIQIGDIDFLAVQQPLLVTIDFTINNISQVLSELKNISGVSLFLAEKTSRSGVHYISSEIASNLLSFMSERYSMNA